MTAGKLSSLFYQALKLALRAHYKQVDKHGSPYIFHVFRVVSDPSLKTEPEWVVAALHDVLEDTNFNTIHALLHEIPLLQQEQGILDALDIITRKPSQDYFGYIHRIVNDDIARKVKLADINDHLKPPLPVESLVGRYERARKILQDRGAK